MKQPAGIISLLDEPNNNVKAFALTKLNSIVNEFWPEIADAVKKIEMITEDSSFPTENRKLAALLASKVYFHLSSYSDALRYALSAASLFDISQKTEYVETILAKCLDHYIESCIRAWPNKPTRAVDSSINFEGLESIVEKMFDKCFEEKQYRQALGIALETRRMDMFRKAISVSDNQGEMLAYAYRVAMTLIGQREFRDEILRSLVGIYCALPNPDYINMCQCLIFLDNAEETGNLLRKLSSGDEESRLMAFQIAFDLYESGTQAFIERVLSHLRIIAAPYFTQLPPTTQLPEGPPGEETQPVEKVGGEDEEMKEEGSTSSELKGGKSEMILVSEESKKHYEQLVQILGGEVTLALHLQFLIRSNKSDLAILRQTKDVVRVSICHTGTVISNALMHSGTTSDQFLRENLDWLARATNWAKFTATASLGVIHRGHEKEALNLLHTYLPREGSGGTGYSEGGALFALGLIHANHGTPIINYLLKQLRDGTNEMIRHGGCLGLGLAAMGSGRQDVYEALKSNLLQDDAVTGEGAGIAMGLVMLGSLNPKATADMVSYAQETQHEKILRGLALGISFTVFGKLETADPLIERLLKDKDALLRRAGVLSVAMAYCGTAANSAIQKLLKVAVSDTNDDVRRAAVLGLGFLLFRSPEQCPSVVSLLSESYNPHVRYGAALAIGISCAATGSKEALALLEPLTQDPVNYVRQGALIASALLLIQQTEVLVPKVKEFRALYAKVIGDKHEDVMAKFGAILAQGIIDGGGRNVGVSLSSRTGHVWLQGAVGMLLFTHYWYWFPMSLCLGLSFSPSAIIAVNKNLEMPVVEFKSNAKPSMFAYPPPLEEKKKEEKERVATAILSVTAKAKRREADKGGEKKEEPMEVDTSEAEGAKEKAEEEKKEVKKEEATFEMISNPARVMKQQVRYIELHDEKNRWKLVKEMNTAGIFVVRDCTPNEPITLVQAVAAHGPKKEEEEDEPGPPEPFEYTDDD